MPDEIRTEPPSPTPRPPTATTSSDGQATPGDTSGRCWSGPQRSARPRGACSFTRGTSRRSAIRRPSPGTRRPDRLAPARCTERRRRHRRYWTERRNGAPGDRTGTGGGARGVLFVDTGERSINADEPLARTAVQRGAGINNRRSQRLHGRTEPPARRCSSSISCSMCRCSRCRGRIDQGRDEARHRRFPSGLQDAALAGRPVPRLHAPLCGMG